MPLIKDGTFVQDAWELIGDGTALPRDGDVIVSLELLKENPAIIGERDGRTGVFLDNAVDPDELKPYLAALGLIALHFPAFTDGRAYSQARQLRKQLGYRGGLRATGAVLPDQAAFLIRVGFDSFEVDESVSLEVWNNAARAMSVTYQRGYDGHEMTRDRALA